VADLKAKAEKEVQALNDKAAVVQADSTSKINKLSRDGSDFGFRSLARLAAQHTLPLT